MHERHPFPGFRHDVYGRTRATDRIRRATVAVVTGGAVATLALIGLAGHETPPKHTTAGTGTTPATSPGSGSTATTPGTSTATTAGTSTAPTAPAATTQPPQVTTGQS